MRAAIVILTLATATGCASRNASEAPNPDPFEPVNRVTYKFNDAADTYVLRPIAVGYEKITPKFLRKGVGNFFDNLGGPVDIVNAFLQGKLNAGFSEVGRLAVNSTLGIFGIFDPATDIGIAQHDEDFGQTLGVWGVSEGPYLVVPLFGPRTVRSGVGDLVDVQYAPQYNGLFNSSAQTKINLFWYVHLRSTLLGLDKEVERAYDEYSFIRDAYLQNRNYLRYDGNVPEDDMLLDDDFDDEEFD